MEFIVFLVYIAFQLFDKGIKGVFFRPIGIVIVFLGIYAVFFIVFSGDPDYYRGPCFQDA